MVFIEQPILQEVIPSLLYPKIQEELLVIGSNFHPTLLMTCKFGEHEEPAKFISKVSIRCKLPSLDNLTLPSFLSLSLNGFGTALNNLPLKIHPQLSVSRIHPKYVPFEGGILVSITGNNLLPGRLLLKSGDKESFISNNLVDFFCPRDSLCHFVAPSIAANVSSISFHLVLLPDYAQIQIPLAHKLKFERRISVHSVNPVIGNFKSGMLLNIFGEYFESQIPITCQISTSNRR